MNKIKSAVAILLCLCAVVSLPACKRLSPLPRPAASINTIISVKKLEAPVYGHRDSAAENAAKGANAFAFRFGSELVKNTGDSNFVCSPYSVWLPLAALVNATDAEHKDELLAALGASGITESDISRASSRMLYNLTKQQNLEGEYSKDYHYNPLKIANAIFVDFGMRLKREFEQMFADYFRGTAMSVDFEHPEAVDAVNQWASENTDGLITNIVQEFDPDTVVAIANAIYFSDRWTWEFNPDETTENVFHSPNGNTTAQFMLREGDILPYYEDDLVQAIPLTFKSGGGMYIILPKSGEATELLNSMTNDYFTTICEGTELKTGKLLLPRFKLESDVMDLKDALILLGVPLFDEAASPLTGGLIESDIPVWLSSAVQKAYIEVDEKGTTAAAVTVMTAPAGAAPPEPTKPFEMICNRPFVFVLYEWTYDGGNQVLFTGVVNKP